MSAHDVATLERMAFEFGLYSDSYLITEPDREYLWGAGGRAVTAFLRIGRFLHVTGSLICHDDDKTGFIRECVEFAKLNRLTISFFHIDESELAFFRDQGFQVSRFGVETRISLQNHSWSGKKHEWVRRQANYVARQLVVFEEWKHADQPRHAQKWSTQFAELADVARESLQGRAHHNDIPFFEGRLLKQHLGKRRIFVARANEGAGRIEGFLLCTPMKAGTGWAIEMYRKRADAVRGTVPFLIKHATECLQQEGCHEVSLCPLPAVECDKRLEGDSLAVRTALKLWKRFGYALFDINGLLHFKSRFRPDFRQIYVCAFPRSGTRATFAYMKAVGMLNISVGSLFNKLIRWNPMRRTLAAPKIQHASPSSNHTVDAASTKAA